MKKIYLLALLVAVLFSGCRGTESVINRFYLLEYPADQRYWEQEAYPPLPASLEIASVSVHPAFSAHQIAIREESHEIRYFTFNEWAIRPGNSLTTLLKDFFHFNPVFQELVPRQTPRIADYTLETTVFQLEVVKERNRYQARIHLEFKLIDNRSAVVVASHSADQIRELEKRNLNLFAGAINEMFLKEVHELAKQIFERIPA